MKQANIFILIGSIAIAAIISFITVQAFTPKIAYVKNQQLFSEFTATKALQVQLEHLTKRHQLVLDSMSMELALIKSKGNQQVFEQKAQLFTQVKQEFTSENQTQTNEKMTQLWNQINQYVKEYGEQEGYKFILGATGDGGIMYAHDGKDVTEELIQFINNKYEGN